MRRHGGDIRQVSFLRGLAQRERVGVGARARHEIFRLRLARAIPKPQSAIADRQSSSVNARRYNQLRSPRRPNDRRINAPFSGVFSGLWGGFYPVITPLSPRYRRVFQPRAPRAAAASLRTWMLNVERWMLNVEIPPRRRRSIGSQAFVSPHGPVPWHRSCALTQPIGGRPKLWGSVDRPPKLCHRGKYTWIRSLAHKSAGEGEGGWGSVIHGPTFDHLRRGQSEHMDHLREHRQTRAIGELLASAPPPRSSSRRPVPGTDRPMGLKKKIFSRFVPSFFVSFVKVEIC